MSAFKPSGGGGGGGSGITPDQLDQLVSDPELAVSLASTEAAIKQRVTDEAVTTRAALASVGAYPGQILLMKRSGVQAGLTQLSGVYGPVNLFYRGRILLANYDYAAAGNTALSALTTYPAAVTAGGNVLLLGTSGQLREFNPNTEAWASKATCTSSPYTFSHAATCGAHVHYLTPTNNGLLNSRYDPMLDAWSTRAPLPNPRILAGVAYDSTTARLYLFGGHSVATGTTDANMRSDIAVYDPVANTWLTKTGMPYRMANARATSLGGGKILVMAPRLVDATTGVPLADTQRAWVYDAVADTWAETDSLPAEVLHPASTTGVCVPVTGGKVAYVPYTAPTAGGRGRMFTLSAAAGTRWSNITIASTTDANGSLGLWLNTAAGTNSGTGYCILPNGLIVTAARQTSSGTDGLVFISLNTDGTIPTADQNYYMKT